MRRYREWRDICHQCHGMQIGTVDFKEARYETLIPSRCPNKDRCELQIMDKLHIKGIPDRIMNAHKGFPQG